MALTMSATASPFKQSDRVSVLESAVQELTQLVRELLRSHGPTDIDNIENRRGPVFLDSNEVCERISCHKNTLNRWRKQGKIPSDCWQRTGHRYKYRELWVYGAMARRAGKVGY
jgi:hypothetical protein